MLTRGHLVADRYQLGEVLGTGGVAEVRRARDTLLGRDVAIKLLQPGCDPADARRFDSEVRTLAGLSHPGLVSVYDADPTGETPFLVLELIEGRTLRERVHQGPMSVEDVRRLGSALAEALAYVHAHGFIHRDVKPSNILLDDNGVPHLADFGLARLAGGSRLTRTDQVVGTAAYLAPEQVRGDEITSAVDIYALGLVLLECLTGHREYEGPEIESAVARLHRPPVIPDDLPFDLIRTLSLMTSLTAGRRPTARQCAKALRRASTDPPTRVAHLPGRSRRVLVAAAAVVLMAAAGTGVTLHNRAAPVESAPPVTTTSPSAVPTSAPVEVVDTAPAVAPPPVEVEKPAKKGEPKGDKGKKDGGKGKNG